MYFTGRDSAYLDETSFTERLLVRRGSRAQFDCRFSNSILTEWYFGENKRLTNVPNKWVFIALLFFLKIFKK